MAILAIQNVVKWFKLGSWVLNMIWKWSQWMTSAQKLGDGQSLACSEPKLKFGHFILFDRPKWPFLPLRSIQGVWKWSQWISHAQNLWDRHQNQVYGMFRTKVTNLAILSHFDWPKWPQTAILATQVNLRCLKMVPMDFPCPKTKG